MLTVVIAYEVVRRYRRGASSSARSASPARRERARPGSRGGGMSVVDGTGTAGPRAPRPRRRVPAAGGPLCSRPSLRRLVASRGSSPAPTTSTRPAPCAATLIATCRSAGRPGRPVVRAGRRGQHRPRGHDDPRHLGPATSAATTARGRRPHRRGMLLGRSAARCTPWPPCLRRRPHRLRRRDQHHRAGGVSQFLAVAGSPASRAVARRSRRPSTAPGVTVPGVADWAAGPGSRRRTGSWSPTSRGGRGW